MSTFKQRVASARKLVLPPIVPVGGASAAGVASTGEVVEAEEGSAVSTLNPVRLTDAALAKLIEKRVRGKTVPTRAVGEAIADRWLAPTANQCRKALWAVHEHLWSSIYTGPDAVARRNADAGKIIAICRELRRRKARSDSAMLEDTLPVEDASSISSSSELTEEVSPSSSCSTDLELAELEEKARQKGLVVGTRPAVSTQPVQKTKAKAKAGAAKGKAKGKAKATAAKAKGRTRKPEALAPGCKPKKAKGMEKARSKGKETGKMTEWQRFYQEHKDDPDVLALETVGERNARIGDKYWAEGKPCTKCRNSANCCSFGRTWRARARANLGLSPPHGQDA